MRWEDLCVDCLIHVFAKVGMEDLMFGVPFVCKSWNAASKHPSCWTNLDFRNLDIDIYGETVFADRIVSFSGLLRLAFYRSDGSALALSFPRSGVQIGSFEYATDRCPNLQDLVIPDYFVINFYLDSGVGPLELLLPRWKSLRSLYVGWPIFRRPLSVTLGVLAAHCKSLSALRLGSGAYRDEDAVAVAEHLPRLRILEMEKSCLSGAAIAAILDRCADLEVLVVGVSEEFFRLDDDAAAIVEKASRRLKRFDYHVRHNVDYEEWDEDNSEMEEHDYDELDEDSDEMERDYDELDEDSDEMERDYDELDEDSNEMEHDA